MLAGVIPRLLRAEVASVVPVPPLETGSTPVSEFPVRSWVCASDTMLETMPQRATLLLRSVMLEAGTAVAPAAT